MNLDKIKTSESFIKKETNKEIDNGLQEHEEIRNGGLEDWDEDRLFHEDNVPGEVYSVDNFISDLSNEEFNSLAGEIYKRYSIAIERRNREPLEEERFFHHFFERGSSETSYMFCDEDNGHLLGVVKGGVFIPTHFAPKSIRSGYKLIKKLGKGQMASAMFITEDLAETLKKMPEWKIEDFSFPVRFRDEEVKKFLAHNNRPEIQKLMVTLLAEYIEKESDFEN